MRALQIDLKGKDFHPFKTRNVPLSNWLLVVLLVLIAYLAYNQPFDMKLTMLQSADLIDCTLNGNLFHFYEYTLHKSAMKEYFPSGAVFMGAAYNIILYFALAIWALPVYLINKLCALHNYVSIIEQWGRILMMLLSVGSAVLIKNVLSKFTEDIEKRSLIAYYFLSSPMLIFCVVVLNQYDIVSVFITLLALNFYFEKKYSRFSILISIAICFKLFAVLIFLPLILLAEKRVIKLFLHCSIAASLYSVTTLLYRLLDSGYTATQNAVDESYSFFDRVTAVRLTGAFDGISLFIVFFMIVCIVAYCWKPSPEKFKTSAILLCATSYSVFFVFVEWHPQWFVILLPFLAIMIFNMKDFRLGILLETALTASFLLFWIVNYLGRELMGFTFLYYYTGDGFYLTKDVNIIGHLLVSSGINSTILFSVFTGFLIALLLAAVRDYRTCDPNPTLIPKMKAEHGLLALRSSLILIYLIPPIVVYFSHPVI